MSTTAQLVERIRILAIQVGARSTITDKEILQVGVNPIARAVVAQALTISKSTTIPVLAGTASYAVPSTVAPFLKASAVNYGTAKTVLEWKDNTFIAGLTTTGQPLYWTFWDNKIRLGPVPVANDTLYFDAYGGPTPCVEQTQAATTDELIFPSDAEDAVVYGSALVVCTVTNETTRQRAYAEMYQQKLVEIKQRLNPSGDIAATIQDGFPDDAAFLAFV